MGKSAAEARLAAWKVAEEEPIAIAFSLSFSFFASLALSRLLSLSFSLLSLRIATKKLPSARPPRRPSSSFAPRWEQRRIGTGGSGPRELQRRGAEAVARARRKGEIGTSNPLAAAALFFPLSELSSLFFPLSFSPDSLLACSLSLTLNIRKSSPANAGSSTLKTSSPTGEGCRIGGGADMLREEERRRKKESPPSDEKVERFLLFFFARTLSFLLTLSSLFRSLSLSFQFNRGEEEERKREIVSSDSSRMHRFLAAA